MYKGITNDESSTLEMEWVTYPGMNIHPKFIETELGKAHLDDFVDRVEKNRKKE